MLRPLLLLLAVLTTGGQIPEVKRSLHEITLRVPEVSHLAAGSVSLQSAQATAHGFLLEQAEVLGIPDPSQMVVAQSKQDQLGQTHVVYHQMHQGLRVVNAAVRVHVNPAGEVYLSHAKVVGGLPSDVAPAVKVGPAQEIALAAARDLIGGGERVNIPEPELVILPVGLSRNLPEANPRLSWQFHVSFPTCASGECPEFGVYVSVDAKTGDVLGAVTDWHGIDRKVWDCSKAPGDVNCYIDSPGINGYIHGRSEGQPVHGPHNNAAVPQFGSTDVDDAYDWAGAIHTWTQTSFGLNGANSEGGIRCSLSAENGQSRYYVHPEGHDGQQVSFCPGGALISGTCSIVLCLAEIYEDLLAHEYGHAISGWSFTLGSVHWGVDLASAGARAFDESHSDIMGEAFEHDQTAANDWVFGVDRIAPTPFRSIEDPHSIPDGSGRDHAQRHYDPFFSCETDVNTGEYYLNSTVISHAFYLASEGGDLNGCTITGQGIEFAKQVFHRAFRVYFDRSQNFAGADTKILQACNDLYSPTQCAELEKALQSVELDQPGKCSATPISAPACAVDHTGTAQTTLASGTPTTTFLVGADIWLSLAGATPNHDVDLQLLPQDAGRPEWEETTSQATQTATAAVLPDGTLATYFFTAMTPGTYDVLIDGNQDGHYQSWADQVLTITVSTTSATPLPAPTSTVIKAIQPNPTQSGAQVAFTLSEPGPVTLQIHDVAGRLIRTLERATLDAGTYVRGWDGADDAGRERGMGIYFVKLVTRSGIDSQKLVKTR